MGKTPAAVAALQGWSDDALCAIAAPIQLVIGDDGFVQIEHAAAMHVLIRTPPVTRRLGLLLRALEVFLH